MGRRSPLGESSTQTTFGGLLVRTWFKTTNPPQVERGAFAKGAGRHLSVRILAWSARLWWEQLMEILVFVHGSTYSLDPRRLGMKSRIPFHSLTNGRQGLNREA
jgi:hypothetical protein